MRKIVDKTGAFAEVSIMESARSCLDNQKRIRLVNPRNIWLTTLFFVILIFLSVFFNPITAIINVITLASILLSANNLKTAAKTGLKVISGRIAWMANGFDGLHNTFIDDVEVEIVPKNMHMGDDLEAINIVPIFKEGNYVIIKSHDNPYFIRVFDQEGEEEAYVMEATDEDIETLESELPEYQEYIDALKLQKMPPHLLL